MPFRHRYFFRGVISVLWLGFMKTRGEADDIATPPPQPRQKKINKMKTASGIPTKLHMKPQVLYQVLSLKRLISLFRQQIHVWTSSLHNNEWMNEWTNERMNEWMNDTCNDFEQRSIEVLMILTVFFLKSEQKQTRNLKDKVMDRCVIALFPFRNCYESFRLLSQCTICLQFAGKSSIYRLGPLVQEMR